MISISVIVPVYNKENYLLSCIESLLKQTFKNFELICIDDGSTDHSGELLDQLQAKDERIRVFHTDNQGLSAARNHGLTKATGKYIAFVDSDDIVVPNYLEILYNEAEISQSDVVICRRKAVEQSFLCYPVALPEIKRCTADIMEHFLNRRIRISVEAFAKLFRREILPEKLFTSGIYFEDYELIYTRFFQYVKSISIVEAEMYFMVQSPNSIMRSNFNFAKLNSWFVILKNVHHESTAFPKKFHKQILYNTHNKALHQLLKGIVSVREKERQKHFWLEFSKQLSDGLKAGFIQKKYIKNRYKRILFLSKLLPDALTLRIIEISLRQQEK